MENTNTRTNELRNLIDENKKWVSDLNEIYSTHIENGKFNLANNVRELINHRNNVIKYYQSEINKL